ncbi:hepatic and glial cell adhesion molecule [Narcine bancroftii]|uniref:hepatic and glial cell adhesion molecule n=1 Tax=Narcine bancroftii TaxID=1343680 RepID=UPI003831A63C
MRRLSESTRAMQDSKEYLALYLSLLFGLLQKASGGTSLVTGFLHQSVHLTVEETMKNSSPVQAISWKMGTQNIVEYQCTSFLSPKIFPKFNNHMTYIAGNNSLHIHQLRLQDEGRYVITTVLESGVEIHSYINLTVLVPVSQPNITVQIENSPYPILTMNCTVKNGSNPHFFWIKDNKILVGNQHQASTSHYSLRITKLNSSDCGVYTCFVQNPVNSMERQQLISAEHFKECLHLPDQGQILASTLTLLCVVGILALVAIIKKYKGRQRENETQNEQEQANVTNAEEDVQYSNLIFIHTCKKEENFNSTYCTITDTCEPHLI